MNVMNLSWGGEGNQDGQGVPKHPDGDNCAIEKDEESPSGANKQKEEDVDDTLLPMRCTPTTESPPLTILKEMEKMFLRLVFSQTVATNLGMTKG